ncbi:MAG: aminoacyl--tRNA ligase-related protein, partial [Gemmatimonadales bacterium]
MIDVKRLRQDPDGSRAALARRLDAKVDAAVDRILALDQRRRALLVRTEALKAQRNAQSDEVARRKKAGEDAAALLAELKASGDEVKQLDVQVREVDAALEGTLLEVPNILQTDVPDGDATQNRVVRSWGEPRQFDFTPKPHWELGAALGILDLPAGAAVAGSGFPVFKGAGAKLLRALSSLMLDLHTSRHGYTEVSVPYLVNRASMQGTGQLPKFADELYTITADELFLIPTAEVPVTNLHRDQILDAAALPFGYTAWTPCFRREAGAAGKDT